MKIKIEKEGVSFGQGGFYKKKNDPPPQKESPWHSGIDTINGDVCTSICGLSFDWRRDGGTNPCDNSTDRADHRSRIAAI